MLGRGPLRGWCCAQEGGQSSSKRPLSVFVVHAFFRGSVASAKRAGRVSELPRSRALRFRYDAKQLGRGFFYRALSDDGKVVLMRDPHERKRMRQRSDMKNETASKQASTASGSASAGFFDVLVICNSHRRCTSGKRERGDGICGDLPVLLVVEPASSSAHVFFCDLSRWLCLGRNERNKMACYTAVVAGFLFFLLWKRGHDAAIRRLVSWARTSTSSERCQSE